MVEPFSFALGALYPLRFHKIHIDFNHSHPLTLGTGAFFDIEAEPSRQIPSGFTFRQLASTEIADLIEKFDIGGRIGPGISSDGRLVNSYDFIDELHTFDFFMVAYREFAIVKHIGNGGIQDVGNQGRFPRAGNSGDGCKDA